MSGWSHCRLLEGFHYVARLADRLQVVHGIGSALGQGDSVITYASVRAMQFNCSELTSLQAYLAEVLVADEYSLPCAAPGSTTTALAPCGGRGGDVGVFQGYGLEAGLYAVQLWHLRYIRMGLAGSEQSLECLLLHCA